MSDNVEKSKTDSFTLDSYNGYEKGKRYEKYLTFVEMFGNSNERYITMKDEDGNELHWKTNDYTEAYRNFVPKGVYRFSINYILDHNKVIAISRLKFVRY